MIAVAVAAYGISPDDFIRRNTRVFEKREIQLSVSCEKVPDATHPSWVHFYEMPGKMTIFNHSATVNYAIRKAIEELKCDVVIQTCIDILFTSECLQNVEDVVDDDTGIDNNYSMVESEDKLVYEKLINVSHAGCMALTARNWFLLHGWNERMYGWGWDDTDFAERAGKLVHLIAVDNVPLYHINHIQRMGDGKFYANRNDKNNWESLYGPKWEEPEWGKAKFLV